LRAVLPVFVTRTQAMKPRSQLAPVEYRAVKDAAGLGGVFTGGFVVAFSVGFGAGVDGRAFDLDG